MRIQAGKRRFLSLAALMFLALMLSFSNFDLQVVKAQRKRTTPQRSAQPKPTPKPRTALEKMGAPPPVPTLKQKPVQELNPDDVVKVDTTEVMFPVTVRDANGNLVNNLTRKDRKSTRLNSSH